MEVKKHNENFDNLIDEIIKKCAPYSQGCMLKRTINDLKVYEGKHTLEPQTLENMTKAISALLIKHDILIPTGHHQWEYYVSAKGRAILKTGGWNAYMTRETEREKKEFEKLDFDLKNSKWFDKTKWWPIGISLLALFVSIRTEKIDHTESDKEEKHLLPQHQSQADSYNKSIEDESAETVYQDTLNLTESNQSHSDLEKVKKTPHIDNRPSE